MGTTIEFYSADARDLQLLFSTAFSVEDEPLFFEQLSHYPVADFSLHLLLPDDLDRLCWSFRKYSFPVPLTFRELFIACIWDDGLSESLTVLAEDFALLLAGLNDKQLVEIALDWGEAFHYQEPIQSTPAYQALLQLRKVAQDAVTRKKSLILHILL